MLESVDNYPHLNTQLTQRQPRVVSRMRHILQREGALWALVEFSHLKPHQTVEHGERYTVDIPNKDTTNNVLFISCVKAESFRNVGS